MTGRAWWDAPTGDWTGWKDPAPLVVYEDPNPIVGRLHGPDGAVLLVITERPEVPFGFQSPA